MLGPGQSTFVKSRPRLLHSNHDSDHAVMVRRHTGQFINQSDGGACQLLELNKEKRAHACMLACWRAGRSYHKIVDNAAYFPVHSRCLLGESETLQRAARVRTSRWSVLVLSAAKEISIMREWEIIDQRTSVTLRHCYYIVVWVWQQELNNAGD